jgi:ATP-dependent Clp protease ATP-binding subunit ClpB
LVRPIAYPFDKLTTKFQQALADAQSLAVGNDQQFIEPQHLLRRCSSRTTAARCRCCSAPASMCRPQGCAGARRSTRLPKVEGHGGDVSIGRDLNNLLNLTDKEAQKRGDQFIASEMFLLALADDKGETGPAAKQHGLTARRWRQAIDGRARRAGCRFAGSRRPARSRSRNTAST